MTKASDKLIALSGIAIESHRTRLSPDDQYLAGLWKSQLPNTLLWVGGGQSWEGAATTRSRPRSYRAPSWSWASIDGPISMRATEQRRGRWYHIFAEVLVAETTSAGNNPTGQVTWGYLHLLLLFANATWERGKYGMELAGIFKPGVKKLMSGGTPACVFPAA
jgi:hypothetical protein